MFAFFNRSKIITIAIALTLMTISCKKFLDVGAPVTSTNTANIYQSNNSAISVLTALYADMSNNFLNNGLTSLSVNPELTADNLVLFNLNAKESLMYYQNSYNSISSSPGYWNKFYSQIYIVNAALEGLNNSHTLNKTIKERLLGEAYFTRALYYFYMVNLYGSVPLVLNTDYAKSAVAGRTDVAEIYAQMVIDLKNAHDLLDNTFLDGTLLTTTENRVRPNRMAAAALLARIYIYQKNYIAAEASATEVINNTTLFSLVPLEAVFLKNSKETIWSLLPVKANYNTDEGNAFLLPNGPNDGLQPFYLSASLIDSFEPGDNRKIFWTGTYNNGITSFPYVTKYKVPANSSSGEPIEYSIVLRLAEQYLIRAEARAEQSNISGAVDDLNQLRTRARAIASKEIPNPLPNLSSSLSLTQVRVAILNERRLELFTEYGHRWFDLKRTGNADAIMQVESTAKGSIWNSFQALYPIPNSEILLDTKIKQNPGYN